MEPEHEPGCDQQHAPREHCNTVSPAGSVPPDAPSQLPGQAPRRCLRCGGANAASAQDCKHCGARLVEAAAEPQSPAPAPQQCLTCGGANAAASRYCKHCGAPLTAAEPPAAATTRVGSYHCLKCGLPNPVSHRYCKQCGAALAETRAGRLSGVAFMLNEAQSADVRAILPDAERERLVAHYEDELRSLVAPARPAPTPKPTAAQVQLPVRIAATTAAPPPMPARPAAAEPRFRAPKPPSPPRDCSWLAEQQANLFLFAGAFLVVIAALIYVAYSGEDVSGVTKMALFTAFTLAFLAAGAACLRIPRVVAAGHVFFGVGAILVPLSFVAAYTILSDEDLDPQAMWLAGSLTTAILYTSVATLGLGRHYAFSAGVALISAAAATVAVADLPIEWAPVPFLVLAVAMSGVALGGPEIVRRRGGQIWTLQAHAVAGAAIIAAIMMALIAAPDEEALDLANRWFLPAAFAVTAAYAGLYALGKRETLAGAALAAAFGGAFVTVVYATSLPAEQYAIAFAALALLFGIVLPAVEKEGAAGRLPADFAQSLHVSAIAATLAAATAGYVMASTRPGADVPDYLVPETHWFAAPALALLLAFYLLDAFGRRQRIAVTGSAIALAGLGASLVYGFDASPEYYALALTGAGAAMVIFLRWIAGRIPQRMTAPEIAGDTSILAQVALASGAAVAGYAALTASDPAIDYTPQTTWFLLAAFASAFAAYAVYVTLPMPRYRWQDRAAVVSLVLALIGAAAAVVYGLDASAEYYALGFTGAGVMIVAGLHGSLPRIKNAVLLAHVEPTVRLMAQAALTAGVAVAVAAAISGADPNIDYAPETRWFLFAAFGWALGGYLLYAMLRSAAAQWHDHLAHLGLGLALTGTGTSVVYGLDARAEYYAFAFVAGAAALVMIAWLALPRVQPEAAAALRDDYVVIWHLAALVAGFVAVGAVFAAEAEDAAYVPDARWFLPLLFASLAGFYGLAVASRVRPSWGSEPIAPLGFVAAVFGVTSGVVWAVDVSAEYYAFAFLVPATALGLAGRRAPEIAERLLPARWQEAAMGIGRAATAVGVAIAVVAAVAASDPESTYRPDSHAFLPLAFLAATVFLALDASRKPLWWTTTALLAAMGGAGVSTVYALDAGAEYYGVAFACVGIAFGFAGRTWSPRWIDARARDIVATVAITTAWLPFEGIYGSHEQIGAGVHLAAAAFYALAAVVSRSERTLGQVMNLRTEVPVRVATGWLYAAGWVTTVGYVLLLRGLPAGEGAGASSLAMPLMGLCLGFLLAGASTRFWRAEFGIHLYIMGLLLSIASLTAAPDAAMLAVLATVFAAAFLAVAAWEDTPLLAVPSAVFGFIAVAAWQQRLDAPQYVIPLAYSTIAAVAYLSGFAMRRDSPRWSAAARACGATYALVSPAAGFGILSAGTEGQSFEGAPFEESALYQWSTLGVAIAGIVATIESSIARRGWAVVAGSGVLTAAVLLEIGHYRPENIQAYTAVIGAYLVLLGLLGLWKFRLIPEMEDAAPGVEAMGAAVVMLPSFVQSLEGGWQYSMILLAEAAVFFAVSVALRRRLLLGAALLAMVLVAGRALFDAINALPNWVVILIAGLALLGIGTAILVGRDRWASWERSLLSWWDEAERPQHV